jgi:signal transduction histidine kinase
MPRRPGPERGCIAEQATGILNHSKHRFLRRYQAELQSYLRRGSSASSRRTDALGRSALANDLEILELAHIHAEALLALIPVDCPETVRSRTVKRAGAFFLDVLIPIERTHRAVAENSALLWRSNRSLRRRTADLIAANRLLRREIAQRKAAEHSLRLSEQRMRRLSHRVLLAQEEERREISRELHDEIAQILTGINVQLASLKFESGVSNTSLAEHIRSTQRLVEKSVDIVHQFARDLRPTLLDDLGLIPALHSYLKAFAKRTGLRVAFSAFAGVEKMRNDSRIVLYRVAQAALVNVAEHAHAARVSVALRSRPRAVLMEIKDDGRSFDVGRVLDPVRNKRLGLIGMRERVEMVGGSFRVESAPGRGTTVSAVLPFKRQAGS